MTNRDSPQRIKQYVRNRLLLLAALFAGIVVFSALGLGSWVNPGGWLETISWLDLGSSQGWEGRRLLVLGIAGLITLMWIGFALFGLVGLYYWLRER